MAIEFNDRRSKNLVRIEAAPVHDDRGPDERRDYTATKGLCPTCVTNKLTRTHEKVDAQCSECTADQAHEMAENDFGGTNFPANTFDEWHTLAKQGHIRHNPNTGGLRIPKWEELLNAGYGD